MQGELASGRGGLRDEQDLISSSVVMGSFRFIKKLFLDVKKGNIYATLSTYCMAFGFDLGKLYKLSTLIAKAEFCVY